MLRLLSVRLAATALAGLAVGAGGGYALAAVVGGTPVPAEKAGALERLDSVATTDSSTEFAPPPAFTRHPIPGQLLGPDVPIPIPPSILRARNGWLVSDGRNLVAVYAGAAGDDSSVGRVVVVRQDLASGKQSVRTVDAGTTGALAIAAAPLGASAEASALTATIRLRTDSGRSLALDLRTDVVGSP